MSKSSRPSGSRAAAGVSLVDVSVTHAARRRAKLAFWTLSTTGAGLGGAVAAFDPSMPLLDVAVGALTGAGLGLVVAAGVRAWSVLRVLWHWALELASLAGLVLGWLALADATTPLVASFLLAGLAGVLGGVPGVRRRLMRLVWCAVVRHRLRLCFAEFIRTPGKSAAAPLILAARPTPAGERVWVWLRPGLDLTDLEGRTGMLAVACWASDVRVVRASRRFAALLRVDIARRDPLTGRISSPLAGLVPDDFTTEDAPVSPGGVPVGLDLADIPDPADDDTPTPSRPARSGRPTKTQESTPHEFDAFI